MLSCGKDNRTLCWNPQSGEIIGELPATNDWSFQTTWCPRNPDLLATAAFDGHIGIHSLQTTHVPEQAGPSISETATADDVFGALGDQEPTDDNTNVLSLKQPPKWLRRPVSATFGYGGLLATTSNLPGASGKHQSGVVHLRNIVTEQSIIDRAEALGATAGDKDKLAELCNGKVDEDAAWKTLSTLFKADSRDELIRLLGFSKDDVAQQVQEAIKQFPSDRVPTVTFADPEPASAGDAEPDTPTAVESKPDPTSSEVSLTSDTTKQTGAETESTEQTEQSLFDEDPGTPAGTGADFFSSMAAGGPLRNPQLDSVVPRGEVAASSVAATVGSRASSVRSEAIKENNFHIYPSGEGDVDRLITQALVLGDFKSAVELCLASERYADALLLAVRGGPDLLASTQKAYFNRHTTSRPFLRVFQSIVTEDLVDIVQNADLAEWKVVFVVLCTFAKDGDFANLAEQLGQRLHHRSKVLSNSDSPEAKQSSKTARGDATLCYLAARRLEKVVSIWSDEMREEEESDAGSANITRYSAHAHALQSFIEKVAVFSAATGYVDDDLAHPTESAVAAETGARTYKLSGLYDRFYEYADLLATQGQVDMAARYVQMTPSDYRGTGAAGSELDKARDRLFKAAGVAQGSSSSAQASSAFSGSGNAKSAVASSSRAPASAGLGSLAQPTGYGVPAPASSYQPTGYGQPAVNNLYAPQQQQQPQQQQSYGGGYADQHSSYAPPPQQQQHQQQQPQPSAYAPAVQQQQQQRNYQPTGYGATNGYPNDPQPQGYGAGYAPAGATNQGYGSSPYGAQGSAAPSSLAPPPRANQTSSGPSPVPAAQRRDMPGWNDAPSFAAQPPKRPQSAAKSSTPAPIMSPFPMSDQNPIGPNAGAGAGGLASPPRATPPPPRGAPGVLPPPPKGGPRPPSAQAVAHQAAPPPAQQARPPPPPAAAGRGGPPPPMVGGPPPPRALSPLAAGGRPAQQPPPSLTGQFRNTPPPGPPVGGPPPPGHGQRMAAGPPPPGRTSSAAASAPAPIQPARSTPSPRPTPPPAAPAKPTHRTSCPLCFILGQLLTWFVAAGDRSHIPSSTKPIFDVLSSELGRVKQMNHPVRLGSPLSPCSSAFCGWSHRNQGLTLFSPNSRQSKRLWTIRNVGSISSLTVSTMIRYRSTLPTRCTRLHGVSFISPSRDGQVEREGSGILLKRRKRRQ